jgi:hypothetical protein
MYSIYVISLVLMGLSGVLLDSHRRSWRSAQQDAELSDRDRRFALGQYRRRMQASSIIGGLGAAIGMSPIIPRTPLWIAVYLASLVGACACILILALLDLVASQQNFRRLRSEQLTAEAKLARELQAAREAAEQDAR